MEARRIALCSTDYAQASVASSPMRVATRVTASALFLGPQAHFGVPGSPALCAEHPLGYFGERCYLWPLSIRTNLAFCFPKSPLSSHIITSSRPTLIIVVSRVSAESNRPITTIAPHTSDQEHTHTQQSNRNTPVSYPLHSTAHTHHEVLLSSRLWRPLHGPLRPRRPRL